MMSDMFREERSLTTLEKVTSALCFFGIGLFFALISPATGFVDMLFLLIPYTALYYVFVYVFDYVTGKKKANSQLHYYALASLFVFIYGNLALSLLILGLLG